jgi:hypothetical protein
MKTEAYEVVSKEGYRNLYFNVDRAKATADGDQVIALVKRDEVRGEAEYADLVRKLQKLVFDWEQGITSPTNVGFKLREAIQGAEVRS